MKHTRYLTFLALGAVSLLAGCQSIDTSIFGGSFGRNSSAMVGGGSVAGQDYVIGLKPSEAAQQYFASASLSGDAETVTVTPGDDKGTGVTWTDDGGITIPPGTTIEFTNKGCCLDPHLPAPKADEEMQFIKTSCLIPTELQGTYKNLLRRAAAGDEDVKSNLQHLMWTLRTAGSNDAYAKNLTDRQREILNECADGGSFDTYCQNLHRFDGLKKLVMAQIGQVAEKLQVDIGNVTYNVSDLLDPELGKQKVSAHLGELIHMNEYLPVVQSGFNYGELEKGIYTDIKGNGTLSFKAKVANSTSEPFVFYPMDYVAQVGSGQNMQGAFFAAADSTMRQRTTNGEQNEVEVKQCEHAWRKLSHADRNKERKDHESEIDDMRNQLIHDLMNMSKEDGFEYGSIIYLYNGEIKATPLIRGNQEYEFATWSSGHVRTTERNGRYYEYDSNNNVIWDVSYGDWYGSHWSFNDRVFDWFTFRVGSYPAGDEMGKLPNGAVPLEIFHMHPDDNHWYGNERNHTFSEQDQRVANEQGVNISVVDTAGDWRLHKPSMDSWVCTKCGARRQ